MNSESLNLVVLGLSISSSWGNGHATTYRALLREFSRRGHRILFLERDVPWYRDQRDLSTTDYCQLAFYSSLEELNATYAQAIEEADAIVVGSYVPEGIAVGRWVLAHAHGLVAFYDIDTPITLAHVQTESCEYLDARLISQYDLYLSFTGGPTLERLEQEYRSPAAKFLPCCVDPSSYYLEEQAKVAWDLGYLGTYSADRQPKVEQLLCEPARHLPQSKFAVAGPLYPIEICWPSNVSHVNHLPPADHRSFYNSQRFTLNITRQNMVAAGYSPSVRLFEAAACGTPIISDQWPGLASLFEIGSEILVSESSQETVEILEQLGEDRRRSIGERAKNRVLKEHTAAHRAAQLERFLLDAFDKQAASGSRSRSGRLARSVQVHS